MKDAPTQFDMRENTASSRRHASRRLTNVPTAQTVHLLTTEEEGNGAQRPPASLSEEFDLPLTEPDKGTTGGRASACRLADGLNRTDVERPLTCDEAAAIVRVHPKTVKRMARNSELPGHFRFGRWFFYASELDCWMRMEIHSTRHP